MTKKVKSSAICDNDTNRYVFCDNYYTKYTLGITIDNFSDGEIKLTGTIRTNYIELFNK